MEFEYNNVFEQLNLKECPPSHYIEREMTVFRWILEDGHENNFKPQYLKKPSRFFSKTEKQKCESLALSMFISLDSAVDRFLFFKKNMGERVYDSLGKFVARGTIYKEDGVNGKIDSNGHFNHHPRVQKMNYANKFTTIETL